MYRLDVKGGPTAAHTEGLFDRLMGGGNAPDEAALASRTNKDINNLTKTITEQKNRLKLLENEYKKKDEEHAFMSQDSKALKLVEHADWKGLKDMQDECNGAVVKVKSVNGGSPKISVRYGAAGGKTAGFSLKSTYAIDKFSRMVIDLTNTKAKTKDAAQKAKALYDALLGTLESNESILESKQSQLAQLQNAKHIRVEPENEAGGSGSHQQQQKESEGGGAAAPVREAQQSAAGAEGDTGEEEEGLERKAARLRRELTDKQTALDYLEFEITKERSAAMVAADTKKKMELERDLHLVEEQLHELQLPRSNSVPIFNRNLDRGRVGLRNS
jgi:hypothetical protein